MIVEVCRSQEEFGDKADSCSEVTLQHTEVFYSNLLYSTNVRGNNKESDENNKKTT